MIIDAKQNNVKTSDNIQSASFTMEASAAAFRILSDDMYSNKIGAIIRELYFNALDSHVAAGIEKTTPVHIHLPTKTTPTYYIEDFGIGLSHDQVMEIYTSYFNSTKTGSNDFVGALGIGSKSPFSYTDVFNVIARHDGIENAYSMFIGEAGIPQVAQMYSKPTDEGNGLKIVIEVKGTTDASKFHTEVIDQLAYVEYPPKLLNAGGTESEYKARVDLVRKSRLSDSISCVPSSYTEANVAVEQGGVKYDLEIRNLFEGDDSTEFLMIHNMYVVPNSRHITILHVPIGTCSFTASREQIAYTNHTKARLIELLLAGAKEMHSLVEQHINGWDLQNVADVTRMRALAIVLYDARNANNMQIGPLASEIFDFKVSAHEEHSKNLMSILSMTYVDRVYFILRCAIKLFGDFEYKGEDLKLVCEREFPNDTIVIDASTFNVADSSIDVGVSLYDTLSMSSGARLKNYRQPQDDQWSMNSGYTAVIYDDIGIKARSTLVSTMGIRWNKTMFPIKMREMAVHVIYLQHKSYTTKTVGQSIDMQDPAVLTVCKALNIETSDMWKLSDILNNAEVESLQARYKQQRKERIAAAELRKQQRMLASKDKTATPTTEGELVPLRQLDIKRDMDRFTIDSMTPIDWMPITQKQVDEVLSNGHKIYYVAIKNGVPQDGDDTLRYLRVLRYAAVHGKVISHKDLLIGVPQHHIDGETPSGRKVAKVDTGKWHNFVEVCKNATFSFDAQSVKYVELGRHIRYRRNDLMEAVLERANIDHKKCPYASLIAKMFGSLRNRLMWDRMDGVDFKQLGHIFEHVENIAQTMSAHMRGDDHTRADASVNYERIEIFKNLVGNKRIDYKYVEVVDESLYDDIMDALSTEVVAILDKIDAIVTFFIGDSDKERDLVADSMLRLLFDTAVEDWTIETIRDSWIYKMVTKVLSS